MSGPFLSRVPIDAAAVIESVSADEHGALATFVGLVRDHHLGRAVVGLEYSAYGSMAERECARIVADAEARWPARVGLQHRLGVLEIGDIAVVVAAGSAHRDAAFDACRYVIEEVKRTVPIWKREHYADGTEAWVDPTVAAGMHPVAAAGDTAP
jgi:molybdopterin synthase catalytic subunit